MTVPMVRLATQEKPNMNHYFSCMFGLAITVRLLNNTEDMNLNIMKAQWVGVGSYQFTCNPKWQPSTDGVEMLGNYKRKL